MSTFDVSKASPAAASSTKQAHDSDAPPNLVAFMMSKWKATVRPAAPLAHAAYHRARRKALAALFPGETLVIGTGHRQVRANDQYYPFRPGSDFFYLTGCHEPDCVLVLEPSGEAVLYTYANPGKTDATFFTDRMRGELWEGPWPGVPEVLKITGVDQCRPLTELPAALAGLKKVRRLESDAPLAAALGELRLLKDKAELGELRKVIAITKRGFDDVIGALQGARSERELETTFWSRARQEGNDVGYGTIAAAGAHACTLHWKQNDGRLRPKDLLLLDAGVEGTNLYTADVTRTLPIGGKFSKEQREVYALVHAAQKAAFKAVRPGNDFMEPNRVAMQVLAEGLEDMGILPVPAAEALKPENLHYKRYTLHNVSHMLGLDVHDCAKARAEAYKFGKLQPGMVLTVEPGLYFQPDDLTVPPKYRGIGVRIEDDVVVTAKGCTNLSAAFPSTADDVEDWMRTVWGKGRAKARGKSKSKKR